MARRDIIHKPIKNALENDGWTIVADPYRIPYKDKVLEADMKADKLIAATNENRSIIIEVKSFLQTSFIHEFIQACGQYQAYEFFLHENGETEKIYMAISQDVHEQEFGSPAVQSVADRFKIRLLIVDIEKENIVQWIEQNESNIIAK